MSTHAPPREVHAIDIRILADSQLCSVRGWQIPCDAIGHYLRDTLQAAPDRLIRLIVNGTELSQERGQLIRDLIRGAGYARVITVGFITEPGQDKGS